MIINAPTIINLHRARIITATHVLRPEGLPPGKRLDSNHIRHESDIYMIFDSNLLETKLVCDGR